MELITPKKLCPLSTFFDQKRMQYGRAECIEDKCMLWVEGDCSLKGIFHKTVLGAKISIQAKDEQNQN